MPERVGETSAGLHRAELAGEQPEPIPSRPDDQIERVPDGPLLVAEVDGELWAAV